MELKLSFVSLETASIRDLIALISQIFDGEVTIDKNGLSSCEICGIRFRLHEFQGRRVKSRMTFFGLIEFKLNTQEAFIAFKKKCEFFLYRNPDKKYHLNCQEKKIELTDLDGRVWSCELQPHSHIGLIADTSLSERVH